MPRFSCKATIVQDQLAAGDTLSGKLWINPGSSIGRQSSSPEISSICIAARCRVRAEWEESSEIKRRGEVCAYRVEKQLLSQPLEITGPKVLDFKLTLPSVVQRTASSWNPSGLFQHTAGHEIPPSLANVVEHALEIELKSEGGFFRSSKQMLEIPYQFVKSRQRERAPYEMLIESKHVTHRPPGQRRNTVPMASQPRNPQEAEGSSNGTAYYVTADMPGRVHVRGRLPLGLTVKPGRSAQSNPAPEILLTSLIINVISITSLRVKLAENTKTIDPEKKSSYKERFRLKELPRLNIKLREGMRIDDTIEGLRVVTPGGVPTFQTYNVSRNYILELWITISIGNVPYDLKFAREVIIESNHYRRPNDPATVENEARSPEQEGEDDFLPAYEGRPPSYTANADNRMSLTAQAQAQGVDIIDLL